MQEYAAEFLHVFGKANTLSRLHQTPEGKQEVSETSITDNTEESVIQQKLQQNSN